MNIGDVFLRVLADDKGFEANVVKSAEKAGDKAGQSLGARLKAAMSPQKLAVAGFAAGAAGIGLFAAGLVGAVKSLMEIERLNAQTDAAIRSTGGAANVSRQHIEDLAEGMESLTTTEREVVQQGANLLLTFTRIRNEAGKGNDIFDRATETALDLSVALGTDMSSASMLLGKALNDPIRGVTALTKAGVQLTKAQKDQIKAFVASGDILSAQKIILAELETQVGGSAEAFANTTAGRVQRFQNDVGNMFESIIVGATKVADALADDAFEGFAMNFGTQGDRVHALADRMGTDFDELKTTIETKMDESGDSFEEVMTRMEDDARAASKEVPDRMSEAVRFAAESITKGGPVVADEAGKVAGLFPNAIKARDEEIRDAAYQNMVSQALGILDGQNEPQVAFDAMLKLQEEELDKQGEINYLKGLWFDARLAQGLEDNREGVSGASDAVVAIIADRLGELGIDAYDWGNIITDEMARGLIDGTGAVEAAARGVSSATGRQLGINSEPKAPDSGLRGITKWGGNIVKTIADDMLAHVGYGANAAAVLAGKLVPRVAGVGMLAGASGGAAGDTYNWNLHVDGMARTVGTKRDAIEELDRIGKAWG